MECYTNELSMESMAQPWSMQYQVYSNLGQCYTGPQEGQIFYGSVQRVPGAVRGALLSPLCLANVRTPVRFYMYTMCIYIYNIGSFTRYIIYIYIILYYILYYIILYIILYIIYYIILYIILYIYCMYVFHIIYIPFCVTMIIVYCYFLLLLL